MGTPRALHNSFPGSIFRKGCMLNLPCLDRSCCPSDRSALVMTKTRCLSTMSATRIRRHTTLATTLVSLFSLVVV